MANAKKLETIYLKTVLESGLEILGEKDYGYVLNKLVIRD